jgi:hypothetical protein
MKFPCAVLTTLMLAVATPASATFFQGFETDTSGWFGATRVSSGTHGVPSKTGAFHAEDPFNGGSFTRWGGYSKTFPPGGYTTSVDIYLDIQPFYMSDSSITSLVPYPNDTRFDWTSAVSTPTCAHRRDFVFNAGFYTDTDLTGSGPRFVISASNNTGRGNSFPKNPGRMPYTISLEGWYTFEHRFRDNGSGILAVDLTIKNSLGVPLMMWTLSTPTDVIGTTVGGNRYGWFATNEFNPALAFDNSALVGFQDFCTPPASTPNAKVTAGGWIPADSSKANFGLTAKTNASGTPSGHLTYQDHAQNRTVQSTAISSVVVDGTCATVLGTAKVNGAGAFGFEVRVCDNGEPGDADTFSIFMSDGYTNSDTLGGGNVQLH